MSKLLTGTAHVCMFVCVERGRLLVCLDDAFSDGVSYLVEDMSVISTADEELVLRNSRT